MPKMTAPTSSPWDHDVRLLALLSLCVSVFSFLYYFRRGEILLYGDAVAHINIARRVFDSRTPGLLQLGTVWLPLAHLLMIPFLISDSMWMSGLGGSIPSMAAYVLGVLGIFRLARGALSRGIEPTVSARVAAWTAAAIYAANPNLIYMQSTAMGEALYLGFFIWAVVYVCEFQRGDTQSLTKCAICLAAACLTRYDGWFLTAALTVAIAILTIYSRTREQTPNFRTPAFRAALAKFVLIAAFAPTLWLAYNAAVYRNPLEFANGPYSARAVEKNTSTINPAKGNLYAAASYFLKSAELNVAEPEWLGRLCLVLAVAGSIAAMRLTHRAWMLLLLWIPLPFYALSLAYGRVPIFVPVWWPFSHYNVRYGLELLPAFAASTGVAVYAVLEAKTKLTQISTTIRRTAVLLVIAIVIAGYASAWKADPICYREAAINMRGRLALEKQLSTWLKDLPPNVTLLMYLGEHPGAAQQAGLPLRRIINEGNHRVWMQPSDPAGLWERALAKPENFADYALVFEGDSVWHALQGRHLKELVEIKVTGQARAILYRTR